MVSVISAFFLFIDPLYTPRFSRPFRYTPVSGVGVFVNGLQQENRMASDDSGIHQLPPGKSFPAQLLIRNFKRGQFGAPVIKLSFTFQELHPLLRIASGSRTEFFQTRTQIFPFFLPADNSDILPDGVVLFPFYIIIRTRRRQTVFLDVTIVIRKTERQILHVAVSAAGTGNCMLNLNNIVTTHQFRQPDRVTGIKTALILFHPEGITQNLFFRCFISQCFDRFTILFAQILLFFLVICNRHARIFVIYRTGKFHVDLGIGIDFSRFAKMIDQTSEDVQRPVYHRIVDHSQIHFRKNPTSGMILIIGTAVVTVQQFKTIRCHVEFVLQIVFDPFRQGKKFGSLAGFRRSFPLHTPVGLQLFQIRNNFLPVFLKNVFSKYIR